MELLKKIKIKEGEEVLLEVKHHPIVIIPHLVISLLILILDFFLMYFLFLQGWWGVTLFGSVIFVVFVYSLRILFLYNRNKFFITNFKIVDFEQPGFFEHYVNEVPLHKVEEIQVKRKGVFGALFGYGSLKLVIRGEVAPLELYRIPKPVELQSKLNEILSSGEEKIKEKIVKDDPISLILAETRLLSVQQKEDLIERIGQQIDEEDRLSGAQGEVQQ